MHLFVRLGDKQSEKKELINKCTAFVQFTMFVAKVNFTNISFILSLCNLTFTKSINLHQQLALKVHKHVIHNFCSRIIALAISNYLAHTILSMYFLVVSWW